MNGWKRLGTGMAQSTSRLELEFFGGNGRMHAFQSSHTQCDPGMIQTADHLDLLRRRHPTQTLELDGMDTFHHASAYSTSTNEATAPSSPASPGLADSMT